MPRSGASADQVRADPRAYFESLSTVDQDRLFTKAGAEAIRQGADINQTVNARRGMFTAAGRRLTTTSTTARGVSPGARLMPEQILAGAGSRDEALRLLDRFGYLRADLRPIQVPAVPVATGAEALSAARAGLDRIRPGGVRLTSPQRSALRDYESATGLGINAALRSGDDLSRFVADRVTRIDDVMAAAPLASDVAVWRGVADTGRVFGPAANGRLTGAVWTERGYLSTTASEQIAREFADPGGDTRAVMRLRVPRGTGAVRISGAGVGGQAELLLQRDLRLRVVADTGPGSVPRRIDVEIVP